MPGDVVKRARVLEWRYTRSILEKWRVRYWIESDPKNSGISRDAAKAAIEKAELEVRSDAEAHLMPPEAVAKMLLDVIPAANAIEVCDDGGTGVVLYRDWP